MRAAPVGAPLTCTARVIGGGQRVTFVEAEITDARRPPGGQGVVDLSPDASRLSGDQSLARTASALLHVQAQGLLDGQVGDDAVLRMAA